MSIEFPNGCYNPRQGEIIKTNRPICMNLPQGGRPITLFPKPPIGDPAYWEDWQEAIQKALNTSLPGEK